MERSWDERFWWLQKGGPTRGRPNLTNHHYKEHRELSSRGNFCNGVNTLYAKVERRALPLVRSGQSNVAESGH
jgi:hypothetical protein